MYINVRLLYSEQMCLRCYDYTVRLDRWFGNICFIYLERKGGTGEGRWVGGGR